MEGDRGGEKPVARRSALVTRVVHVFDTLRAQLSRALVDRANDWAAAAAAGAGRLRAAPASVIRREYPTAIAVVEEGSEVKVVGRLRYHDAPLRAPISGRSCACWAVHLPLHRVLSPETRPPTRQVARAASSFYVEDRTGRVLVRAEAAAELLLVGDRRYGPRDLDLGDTRLDATLRSVGLSADAIRDLGAVYEGALEEGEEVAVYGLVEREPDPDAAEGGSSYRETASRLVLTAPPERRLICSDDPFSTA
jgi:hypothetical protein